MMKNTNEPFLKNLGARIRELRKARSLTQENLAELCDLHTTYIGGIERGERNPSIYILLKIAEGLKVELKDLMPFISKKSSSEREEILSEFLSILRDVEPKQLRRIKTFIPDIIRWVKDDGI